MRFLYPSDPTNPRSVDDTYGDECQAIRQAGFAVSLFSFEDFESGRFRAKPALSPDETVLYRGWMLTVPRYEELVGAIGASGAKAFTSVQSYKLCHHLPEWYSLLQEHTAETVVLAEDADFSLLDSLGWPGYFVKDYVKSLSTAGGSLAESATDIAGIVALMKKYRGFIEGGVCIRKRQNFRAESERRFFVFQGQPLAAKGVVPRLVAECAQRIASPFFSVDTAVGDNGMLCLVELGDGQVSDRKEWAPERFVEIFADVR